MAFESCNLLSDFHGPNESPILEANRWFKLNSDNTTNLTRSGNKAASSSSVTGESYYTPGLFGPIVEVYCTIDTMPASGNNIDITLRIQNAGGASSYHGYRLRMLDTAGTDQLQLARVDSSILTNIGTPLDRNFSVGEKIGIRCVKNVIEGWYYSGGVWTLGTTALDNTYPNAGNVALHIRGTTGRVSDFYAGQTTFRTPPNILGRGVSR